MPHPAEYYVRFLLARAHGLEEEETIETVNDILKSFRIPKLPEEEWEFISRTFNPPRNFQFYNKEHKATRKFMEEEKIDWLWFPEEDRRRALDLMDEPQVKECIQTLLMNRIPSTEISTRVGKRFKMEVPAKTIETFKHFFWNANRASADEWGDLLWRSKFRDHYLAALCGSRNQALYRAGFNPKIDGKAALREAHRALSMRIEATRIMPDTRETTQILTALTKELVGVHNALFGEGAGVEEAMEELRKFNLQRKAPNVIPLRTLAPAGNYSGSGGKV